MPEEKPVALKVALEQIDYYRTRLQQFSAAAQLLEDNNTPKRFNEVLEYLGHELTQCRRILDNYNRLQVIEPPGWPLDVPRLTRK